MENSKSLAAFVVLLVAPGSAALGQGTKPPVKTDDRVVLTTPVRTGGMPLQEALARRASVREFTSRPLEVRELSQLLWAVQGITHGENGRAAPSAGARYPLEVYLATSDGFFHYLPHRHELERLAITDLRAAISQAALGQRSLAEAAAVFVFTAVSARTAQRYGEARTPRYVHLEAGHAAQNLLLQAVALHLGAVPVGAFDDPRLQKAIPIPPDHVVLYLVPVGHPRPGQR